MQTARTEIMALLDAHLDDAIDVIPYAHNIEAPSRSTVMVRVDRVLPGGAGWRTYGMALVLIAARTTAGPADDEADGLLEHVLAALEENDIPNAVTWTEAVRASYGEPDGTNPAYEVTIQAACKIESE